jgi:uncharacterized protein with von Willebrand factor type A (vWA) domain
MSGDLALFLVTEVSRRLREYGVKCGTSESIDAYRSLGLVNVNDVNGLKTVLRLCMVKRLEDRASQPTAKYSGYSDAAER